MKQKILLPLFVLFSIIANAQLTTSLVLNPRPPATLSKWATTSGTITLIINNQGGPQGIIKKVKIKATLKSADGTDVATTNLNIAQIVILQDGSNVLNAATVFPLEAQQFSGKNQTVLNRTGKLPSGNYQLCVELVEPSTYVSLSPAKCGSFFFTTTQLPICMMPANDQALDIIKARTAITFRWTPLVPKPQGATNYRLQVFEVLDNQQPMQALRSNQPILDKIVVEQTQYIWQPQGILGFENDVKMDTVKQQQKEVDGKLLDNAKRYIWCIQTLNALGEPISADANYEGRSEPIVFKIKPTPEKPKHLTGSVTLIK